MLEQTPILGSKNRMKRENPLAGPDAPVRPSKYSKDAWRLVECQETGLVYLENPPDYEALEEDFAWEKTYEEEGLRRRKEEPVFSLLSKAAKGARSLLKRPRKIVTLPSACLASKPKGAEIVLVDVGAGDGATTADVARYLEKQQGTPVRPVAVEISKLQAEQANLRLGAINGGGCVQGSALDGLRQLEGTQADLILLSSFLEHEVQPVELLKACRERLKEDGVLIIKVPNFASWNRHIRQRKWCGFRYPDHVNYFTPKTLRLAIEAAGLQVSRMKLRDRFPLSDNMYAVASRA